MATFSVTWSSLA